MPARVFFSGVDPFETRTAGAARAPRGGVVRRLVHVFGPEDPFRPRSVALDQGRIVFGRAAPATYLLQGDEHASRRHAELSYVPDYDVLRVKDLGSKNGTFVDGRPLEAYAEHLRNGSILGVGESLFAFEELEVPAPISADLLEYCPLDMSLARFAAEFLVDRAAPTGLPVLIRGPTGAGKEALARRVHEVSGRSGPLVSVNCASFTRDLLASELFGHVRGAYSGAEVERKGVFQAAAGGTLFLDEFAEMPLEQQPALLRALQEHRVRPVGADADVHVDVRLVAATHQDVDALEREGRLRGDLLARLAGIVVELPGLRLRKVEVLPLFHELLGRFVPLSSEAAAGLLVHSWPKNVRELKRYADTVRLFLGEADLVDVSLLPAELRPSRPRAESPSTARKEELEALLEVHAGNVAQVARAIGEHRQQVYRWLKVYGIEADTYRRPRKP